MVKYMNRKKPIMKKAIELFANQWIEATAVQQFTDACGISKGAFYLVFKSKTDLILSIVDEFGKRFLLELDQLVKPEQEAQQKLLQFYLIFCEEIFRNFERDEKYTGVT